jgi:signal transduction histidine kinase
VLASQAGTVLARAQLVAALDREAKTMDAVLSNSPLGVLLERADGRIDFANAAITRLYDIPYADVVGGSLDDLYRRAGVVVGEPVDTDPGAPTELRRRDRIIEVRRAVVPGRDGQPQRTLTLHEDVTHERTVQEAKDLMLRAIGHEVRSPAAAMRATIASLLQWHEVMDADQRRSLLDSAYDQSQRLLALVEGQLIISQLETGRFTPNPDVVPLRRSIEETGGLLRFRYGNRVEAIEVDAPPGLPAARCEPTHLGQVLVNLLGNALEYTRADRVVVSGRERDGWLVVTVRDNGGGIAPERVETLFSKMAPAGQKRARGGLGLGLYLCRLVVERSFGGHLWLERTGADGTVFTFTVPAAVADERDPHEAVR